MKSDGTIEADSNALALVQLTHVRRQLRGALAREEVMRKALTLIAETMPGDPYSIAQNAIVAVVNMPEVRP